MLLPFLKPPAVVIVYLQNPRERYWGLVRALDATGIVVHGGDLGSFDAWIAQVSAEDAGPEPSTLFFPLLRVEKVLVDEPAGDAPSLAQRFQRRTGRALVEFLGG